VPTLLSEAEGHTEGASREPPEDSTR